MKRLFEVLFLIYFCIFIHNAQGLNSALIVAEARRCCSQDACSPGETKALLQYISSFDESHLLQEEAQAQALSKSLLNGTIDCSSRSARSPRAPGDTFTISCPNGPYNAGPAAVSVKCTLFASTNENIGYISVSSSFSGSQYNFYQLIQVFNGTETTTYSGSVTITLPRYVPNGVWQVAASLLSYDFDQLASANSQFTISKTSNDVVPPVLNGITITSPWGTNPCGNSNYITVNISDNLSGVASVVVGAFETVNYQYAVYQQLSFNPAVHGSRLIYAPQIRSIFAKNFSLIVTLTDAVNNQVTYTSAAGQLPYIFPTASSCAAGQYSPQGTSACVACPTGLYSNAGAFKCCACPSGTTLSSGTCLQCPSGYTSHGGSTNCTMCPAGTHGYGGVCSPCGTGTFSQAGASTCSPCPSGYTSCVGATTCSKCGAGTYGNTYTNGCIRCPAGSYSSSAGQGQCAICPPSTFSGVGSKSCTKCPSGKKSPAGSNSALNCV